MRILYVHNSADIYGASRSLSRLLQGLDRDRFEPLVVLPEDGPLRSHLQHLGVEVRIDSSLAIISRYTSWFPLICQKFPRSVWRLYRLIRNEHIDLVHTNAGVIFSPGLAAKAARVPHIWHVRESFDEFKGLLWNIYSAYMTIVSDRIVAVSNAAAAQFQYQSKVAVVHNGFPLDEFAVDRELLRRQFRQRLNIMETDFVIGCVGRIKWVRKGQEYLIQAGHLLKKRGILAKYLIVGSPYRGNESHLDRLKDLVRDLDLQNEIIFAGELQDPKPAYAAMDLFVLPSARPEPFGGVVMEAMAMRVPVIATNIGGSLDQVADGVTGFLVPPSDPIKLAEKIEVLINKPQLRQRMSAAALERLSDLFSVEQMLKKIESVYEQAASESQ